MKEKTGDVDNTVDAMCRLLVASCQGASCKVREGRNVKDKEQMKKVTMVEGNKG